VQVQLVGGRSAGGMPGEQRSMASSLSRSSITPVK